MRSSLRACTVLLLLLAAWTPAVEPADKVRVVATITDLKSLTEAVGGAAGGRGRAGARRPRTRTTWRSGRA